MTEEVQAVFILGDGQGRSLRLQHDDLDVAPTFRQVVGGVADATSDVAPDQLLCRRRYGLCWSLLRLRRCLASGGLGLGVDGEKSILETIEARKDPEESANYGAGLLNFTSQALLLRAKCRVFGVNEASQADIAASLSEIETATQIAFPLGNERALVDDLIASLKKMPGYKARP